MQTRMGKGDRKKGDETAKQAAPTAFSHCECMDARSMDVQGSRHDQVFHFMFLAGIEPPLFR